MRTMPRAGADQLFAEQALALQARRAGSTAAAAHALPALLTLDDHGRLQRDEDPAALARYLGLALN